MLMGKDQKKQQPFRSYAALAAKCSQLVQDKRALEAQLEAPLSQVSALESSMEVLYHQLYSSSNQLQLSSPVRQHCPSPGPCWVAGPALGALCHPPWVQGGHLAASQPQREGSWA